MKAHKQPYLRIPSFPEVILTLLLDNVISPVDAKRYLFNYLFFENNRRQISLNHYGKWVASVNDRLVVADTERALRKKLRQVKFHNRAYMVHVERII